MFGKIKTPDFRWKNEHIDHENGYTKDYLWLESKEWHLFFVCDDLMRRHSRHEKFMKEDTEYKAGAFTESDEFSMWKKKVGTESFPIPLIGYRWSAPTMVEQKDETRTKISIMELNATRTGRIKGELYLVRPSVLVNLDKYRENGVQFTRKRTKILVPYRPQEGSTTVNDEEFIHQVKAWMYIGELDYWQDLLHNPRVFSRVTDFEANRKISDGIRMKNYYYYSLPEANNI